MEINKKKLKATLKSFKQDFLKPENFDGHDWETIQTAVNEGCLEKFYDALASNNEETISNYMKNIDKAMPGLIAHFLFLETSDWTINGKNIYTMNEIGYYFPGACRSWEGTYGRKFSKRLLSGELKKQYAPKLISAYKNIMSTEFFGVTKIIDDYIDCQTYESKEELWQEVEYFSKLKWRMKDGSKLLEEGDCVELLQFAEMIGKYYKKLYQNDSDFKYEDFAKKQEQDLRTMIHDIEQASIQIPRLNDMISFFYQTCYECFLEGPNGYHNLQILMEDPSIKDRVCRGSLSTVLECLNFYSDSNKLKHFSEFLSMPELRTLNDRDVDRMQEFLSDHIKDKSLLQNFDVTMPIFLKMLDADMDSGKNLCFAAMFDWDRLGYRLGYGRDRRCIDDEMRQIFEKQEQKLLTIPAKTKLPTSGYVNSKEAMLLNMKNPPTESLAKEQQELRQEPLAKLREERIKKIITGYCQYGLVPDKVFKDVAEVIQKHKKDITLAEIKRLALQNPNFVSYLQDLTSSLKITEPLFPEEGYPANCNTAYKQRLYDIAMLYPKCRLTALPEPAAYSKMPFDMKKNFNLKIWNQFASLPLFSYDDNTKRALVEYIAVMGLFEKDKDVEKRRQTAFKLAKNLDISFSGWAGYLERLMVDLGENEAQARHEQKEYIYENKLGETFSKYFDPCTITKQYIASAARIPEDLEDFLKQFGRYSGGLGKHELELLKKLKGSFGKKVNAFLAPYAYDAEDKVYRLKRDVNIPDYLQIQLKPEMTKEEYDNVLKDDKVAPLFLNPVQEERINGVRPRKNLPPAQFAKIQEMFLQYGANTKLNCGAVHRMFDGCKLEFDPEFYAFLMENFGIILDRSNRQSAVKKFQSKLEQAKKYYSLQGNSEPNIFDIETFLESCCFDVEFGREELAEAVKNAGVKNQEIYSQYQELFKVVESRKLSTLPRHDKTYVYTDKDGKQYTVMAKILRMDDPANMLVGESKFTNCCQIYGNAGQKCMEHASKSNSGGILATYVIGKDNIPKMMTQSWTWTNETKLCLDNAEATSLITSGGKEQKLYQDLATFAIAEAAKDILRASEIQVEKYVQTQKKSILQNANLTSEQKEQKLAKLKEIQARQTINTITIGLGCDDLNVLKSFPQTLAGKDSIGPKKYDGYRDSRKQQIIRQEGEPALPVDEQYEEVPIYRDERRLALESGRNIKHSTLKFITDMENASAKNDRKYTDNDMPKLIAVEALAEIYGCQPGELQIMRGEDWYFVCGVGDKEIKIFDFEQGQCRFEDEQEVQESEISRAFKTILSESVVLNKLGQVENLKTITAQLENQEEYRRIYELQRKKVLWKKLN